MAIITVSRGSFAGGKMVAEAAAKELGYTCYSREQAFERATQFGATKEEIYDALSKAPSLWERFTKPKKRYMILVRAAILEQAAQADIVYHGLAAAVLLPETCPALHVRVIGTMEFRIGQVMESQRVGREAAIQYIHEEDQSRVKWMRFMYDKDWFDFSRYDMVLNINSLDIDTAAKTVVACARMPIMAPSDESTAKIKMAALASQVEAKVMGNPATEDLNLFVKCEDPGVVCLAGSASSEDQKTQAVDIARSVEGVRDIIDEMSVGVGPADYAGWA